MMGVDNQKKNATYINRLNKIQVLQLIREKGEISRASIAKKTKLSAPTVTRIVDDLIDEKLVEMVGVGDSTGGRPPKLIRFDGSHNYVIGIDLGSTSIRGAISNLDGEVVTEIETGTDLSGGHEVVIRQVAELINKLVKRSKLGREKILGAGMAVAGLINPQTAVVEYSPVFNWKNVNLKAELEKLIDIPTFYDNVSRVTALGELIYGIGIEHKNFICVNLGYGIGAGIIIDGKPFYGSRGFTGEFGHIVLDRNSPYIGKDGIRGGLEATSSGYGIAEIAKIRIKDGAQSEIIKRAGSLENITAKMVFECAGDGDELAQEIVDNALLNLGQGVDLLIKLFNPSAIVFTGGLTRNGEPFFKKLKAYTRQFMFSFNEENEQVKILPSSFKDDATLIGAFSLIISKVLQFEAGVLNNGH